MREDILDEVEKEKKPSLINRGHKVHGLFQMLLSGFFLYQDVYLWYRYESCDTCLWLLMYPTWMLLFFIVISGYGAFTGFIVFRRQLTPWRGYLRLLVLLGIGVIVDFLFNL